MIHAPDWWRKPRVVSVVVDNPSWILPFAQKLVQQLNKNGDFAVLCRSHEEVQKGSVAFYLGCSKITPPEILARNQRNLVAHESDLPKGRGFAPLTSQIISGKQKIPICLLEAMEQPDSGPIIYRDTLEFEGHELNCELRQTQGLATTRLCRRFLAEPVPPMGTPQSGEDSTYARRRPMDSRLEPELSIAVQFDLLRTVDNERYPAFFDWRGHRYILSVHKSEKI